MTSVRSLTDKTSLRWFINTSSESLIKTTLQPHKTRFFSARGRRLRRKKNSSCLLTFEQHFFWYKDFYKEQTKSDIVLLYSSVDASFLSTLRNEKFQSIMDYQCIVIYTIVRIAPLNPSPPAPNAASSSGKGEQPNGCLDWIKLQIKRYKFLDIR